MKKPRSPAATSDAQLARDIQATNRQALALEQQIRAAEAHLTVILRQMRVAAEAAAMKANPSFVPVADAEV
jgi:hypothetical protein